MASKKSQVAPKTSEKKTPRRRWTDHENISVLEYLLETVKSGRNLEKPNATAYYLRAVEKLSLEDCTGSQMKNQVRNLKAKYMKTVEWRNKTGQGVLETDGEETFKRAMLNMCPHFDILDEIFGTRISISPPFTHETGLGNDTNTLDFEDDILEEIPDADKIEKQDYASNTNIIIEKCRKRRRDDNIGMDALAMTAKLRFEVQKAEVDLKREQWEDEKLRKNQEEELAKEKFEFDKQMAERKMKLEEEKVKNEFELGKYRIEQEMKLQLELAKVKKH